MADTSVQSSDVQPDVPVERLVVFDKPDVALYQLGVFEKPDISLADVVPFPSEQTRQKGKLREWAESLAGTIVFVLIFTSFVAQATQVPTESMKPTILVGDHFFLDKLAFPGNFPAV